MITPPGRKAFLSYAVVLISVALGAAMLPGFFDDDSSSAHGGVKSDRSLVASGAVASGAVEPVDSYLDAKPQQGSVLPAPATQAA